MKKLLLFMILTVGMTRLPSLEAQQIKVISFNIQNSGHTKADGKNAWHIRRNAVMKMIEKEAPDIMGLQEALLDQLSSIDQLFRNKYRRTGVGADNGLTRGEHNAIYYDKTKFKLISTKTRWLSATPQRVSNGWDSRHPYIVTIARFRSTESGKELYYFNTRLDPESNISRVESINLLVELIQKEVPEGIPVILGGDFGLETLSHLFDKLKNEGLESARDIAPRKDYKNTYNGFGNDDGAMVDHFLTRDINILRFRTMTKGYGVPYISDHYPIVMDIEL